MIMTTYPCKMGINSSTGNEVVYAAREPFGILRGQHTKYAPGTVEDFCNEHNLLFTPAEDGQGYYIVAPSLREATVFKLQFNVEPLIQGELVLDVGRLVRELTLALHENLVFIRNEVKGNHKATNVHWARFLYHDQSHLIIEAAPEGDDGNPKGDK
jgi:hypothetical protein